MTKNHHEICFKIGNLNVLQLKWSRYCAHHVENVIIRGEHRIWEKTEAPELNCYPNNLFLFEKCQLSTRSYLFVCSYHLFSHRKCRIVLLHNCTFAQDPRWFSRQTLQMILIYFFLRKLHINIFQEHMILQLISLSVIQHQVRTRANQQRKASVHNLPSYVRYNRIGIVCFLNCKILWDHYLYHLNKTNYICVF